MIAAALEVEVEQYVASFVREEMRMVTVWSCVTGMPASVA